MNYKPAEAAGVCLAAPKLHRSGRPTTEEFELRISTKGRSRPVSSGPVMEIPNSVFCCGGGGEQLSQAAQREHCFAAVAQPANP